jgi:hypothetical protein
MCGGWRADPSLRSSRYHVHYKEMEFLVTCRCALTQNSGVKILGNSYVLVDAAADDPNIGLPCSWSSVVLL